MIYIMLLQRKTSSCGRTIENETTGIRVSAHLWKILTALYFNEKNSWNIDFIYLFICSDQFTAVSAENDNLQEEHDRLQQRHSKLLHDMTEKENIWRER